MTIANYNKPKILKEGRALTPWFRAAFSNVFQPAKAMEEGKEGRYELTMLFDPKSVDLTPLKEMVYNCAKAKFGSKVPHSATFDLPPSFRSPFRDGDTKPDYTGYEGMIFAPARSKHKPQVIDAERIEIGPMDQPGFYSGCYARASIGVWAYDTKGNKGVSFNLNNVQKLADGEAFGGGRVDAEDEFGEATDFNGPATTPDQNSGGNTESWM